MLYGHLMKIKEKNSYMKTVLDMMEENMDLYLEAIANMDHILKDILLQ